MKPNELLSQYRAQLREAAGTDGPLVQGFWVADGPVVTLSSLENLCDAETLSSLMMSVFNEVLDEAEAHSDLVAAGAEVNRILGEDDIETGQDSPAPAAAPSAPSPVAVASEELNNKTQPNNVVPLVARG